MCVSSVVEYVALKTTDHSEENIMASPKKRRVAAVYGDGHIRLVEQDVPELKKGSVLVEVHASLVSPGTEVRSWRGLAERRKHPDKSIDPKPFGYSNSGVVLEVGEGVEKLRAGDRVACVGNRYAMHTDFAVVPHNLCIKLPESLSFDQGFAQGSYAMLAATGLHAMRRSTPEFGWNVAVVGLGIVGQLTAQLFQLGGCYVIGWETINQRSKIAEAWGIDAVTSADGEQEVASSAKFTGGYGLDAAVIAFGGDATGTVKSLERSVKLSPDWHPMGVIVFVGGAGFNFTGSLTNIDYRRASRTGPGYHDEAWEFGTAYPPVFMRWTTETNLQLCLRLIAEGKLKVDPLTTHTIPLEKVDEEISKALDDPDCMLGVVFTMKG
jgi:threonine dehydrogenase-like Zn-dependent dehydrogenase